MDAALWHWRDVCNTHCWWGYTSIAILHGCYWAIPKLWHIIIQMTWAFCLISLAGLCCWKQAEGRKVLSVLLCHKYFILFFFKDPTTLGRFLGSEGERWGHTPPPPPARALPAPQWAALPHRLGALQAQWTGDIHTVNDSSGSGTTERIENGCKDDYYNFQHLSPKS